MAVYALESDHNPLPIRDHFRRRTFAVQRRRRRLRCSGQAHKQAPREPVPEGPSRSEAWSSPMSCLMGGVADEVGRIVVFNGSRSLTGWTQRGHRQVRFDVLPLRDADGKTGGVRRPVPRPATRTRHPERSCTSNGTELLVSVGYSCAPLPGGSGPCKVVISCGADSGRLERSRAELVSTVAHS